MYADTDFWLVLLKDDDWLAERAMAVLEDYRDDLAVSLATFVELFLVEERFAFDRDRAVTSILELASYHGDEDVIYQASAYVDDGLNAFDAFHAALAGDEIVPVTRRSTKSTWIDYLSKKNPIGASEEHRPDHRRRQLLAVSHGLPIMDTFEGYRRPDGRIGVRNLVAVLPTSVAASPVADAVADAAARRVRATPHQMGTSQPDAGRERTRSILAGVGRNPNVGAALVVELGTEDLDAESLADDIADSGIPVETLAVRDVGGTGGALDRGADLVDSLSADIRDQSREEADASELVFGVECGGSDATSGIAANPAVGNACDRLVDAGGTACISETPEFIGAEHVLAERCVDDATRKKLLDCVDRREDLADLMGADLRGAQPTPGNQDGGLTTIEEKSLGAIAKCGTTPVRDVVGYGERLPVGGGVVVMDSPGYDVESVVGKVAGGAQVVAFTTGRGSTTGNPIAPVIKVTGNPRTADRMASNMDVDASTVIDGEPLDAVGERVYDALLSVADGTRTAAETRRLEEFAINERQPRELAAEGQ